MRKCPGCNREVADGANYCIGCGVKIIGESAEPDGMAALESAVETVLERREKKRRELAAAEASALRPKAGNGSGWLDSFLEG